MEESARCFALPLMAGIGYFLLASITIHMTDGRHSLGAVWPANAILLSLMALNAKRRWPAILMAGFLGNALANLLMRDALGAPFLFGIANIAEVTIAALGLRLAMERERGLFTPSSVLHFMLWAGFIAPGTSAFFGGTTAWFLFGQPFWISFTRWFLADALGLLIFSPFFTALFRGDYVHFFMEKTWPQRAEFVALLAFTALTTFLLFFVVRHALLFLLTIPLMLATFRSGWLGTKMALIIVATIGSFATLSNIGPIARMTIHPEIRVYYCQIYIAATLLIQMPVAAALAARNRLIEKLKDSEHSLRLLASQSPILLLSFDLDGTCKHVVGTSNILLDRDADLLSGSSFADISEEGQFELKRAHNAALDDISCSHHAEFRTVKAKDSWLEAIFRANFDDAGRCVGTLATIHDVTQRKVQELSLSRSATTDSLTGLLNRAGFRARLEQAMLSASPGTISLAMIDVDRFKLINDNSGHQVGDLVLKEIARRISTQVRSSDAVGRLGGDEFIILLNTQNWVMVQDICNRVVATVGSTAVELPSGGTLNTAISCGVARLQAGLAVDDFIHEADLALYEAKRGGRNRVVAA